MPTNSAVSTLTPLSTPMLPDLEMSTLKTTPEEEEKAVSTPTAPLMEDPAVSEKARGKMRERSTSNLVADVSSPDLSSHEEEESEGVFQGKNGFVPTEGWVASWREG